MNLFLTGKYICAKRDQLSMNIFHIYDSSFVSKSATEEHLSLQINYNTASVINMRHDEKNIITFF